MCCQALLADVDLLWQMTQDEALVVKSSLDANTAPQPHEPVVVNASLLPLNTAVPCLTSLIAHDIIWLPSDMAVPSMSLGSQMLP